MLTWPPAPTNSCQTGLVDTLDTVTGNVTDTLTDLTVISGGERYLGLVNDIPFGATETLTVLDFGSEGNKTSVRLLLDVARSSDIRGGAPADNKAIPSRSSRNTSRF